MCCISAQGISQPRSHAFNPHLEGVGFGLGRKWLRFSRAYGLAAVGLCRRLTSPQGANSLITISQGPIVVCDGQHSCRLGPCKQHASDPGGLRRPAIRRRPGDLRRRIIATNRFKNAFGLLHEPTCDRPSARLGTELQGPRIGPGLDAEVGFHVPHVVASTVAGFDELLESSKLS